MTSFRTTRSARRVGAARRLPPHILRRDGVIEAPSDAVRHDRYCVAVAAGWRPPA